MAVHQPHHLLGLSVMEAPPPPAFDNDGLLALQHVDMPAGGGGSVLAGDTAPPPWPQAAVSLSLFNYSTTAAGASSMVSHQHHQPLITANQQLEVPAASSLQQPFQLIRSSKYLGPVRELLGEFCSLEGDFHAMADKQRAPPNIKAAGNNWDDVEALSSSGLWGSPSFSSMDLMELEKRKVRLLSMIEEVDRRYRRYREQMRSLEVSFEAVAGAGATQVYTRLARRAMSRHFRCLRDALVAQLRALKTKAAMGSSERDGSMAAPGATKGETPRLRVLDQCLRQQRSYFQQQPGALDNYPWRPQRGLPERAVAILRAWLFEHFLHPYPNDVDKHILARQTGLSRSQVSNWFINARVRLWKPMIEEMYKEEVNQQSEANQQNPSDTTATIKAERSTANLGGDSYHHHQLLRSTVGDHPANSFISSSSIVTNGDHLFHSSYSNVTQHGTSHGAVSLTLGLQQQPFPSSMTMQHQQQRSGGGLLLEAGHQEQQSVLPYRNLMGSQSLHDFAG